MNIDIPDIDPQATPNVSPQEMVQPEGVFSTIGLNIESAFGKSPLVLGAQWLTGSGPSQTITRQEFQDSPNFRPGMEYQQGMTAAQQLTLANKYDVAKAVTEGQQAASQHPIAGFVGQVLGSTMGNPLYLVNPSEVVPEALTARIAAKAGEGVAKAVTSGLGFSAVNLATQPLEYASDKNIGEQYDWTDAVLSTVGAFGMGAATSTVGSLIHNFFGGNEITAGANKALDDMNNGRDIDVAQTVNADKVVSDNAVREQMAVSPKQAVEVFKNTQAITPEASEALSIQSQLDSGMDVSEEELARLDAFKSGKDALIQNYQNEADHLNTELKQIEEDFPLSRDFKNMTDEELAKVAMQNEVTGLPNKRAFESDERLPVQMNIDLDNFKDINDILGHVQGDRVLRQVGQAMKAIIGKLGGRIYHFSGDEFGAEFKDTQTASRFDKLFQRLLKSAKIKDGSGNVYKSGIGFSRGIGNDQEEAELALQAHKEARKAVGQRFDRRAQPRSGTESVGESEQHSNGTQSVADRDEILARTAGARANFIRARLGRLADGIKRLESGDIDFSPLTTLQSKTPVPVEEDELDRKVAALVKTPEDEAYLKAGAEQSERAEILANALEDTASCYGGG